MKNQNVEEYDRYTNEITIYDNLEKKEKKKNVVFFSRTLIILVPSTFTGVMTSTARAPNFSEETM